MRTLVAGNRAIGCYPWKMPTSKEIDEYLRKDNEEKHWAEVDAKNYDPSKEIDFQLFAKLFVFSSWIVGIGLLLLAFPAIIVMAICWMILRILYSQKIQEIITNQKNHIYLIKVITAIFLVFWGIIFWSSGLYLGILCVDLLRETSEIKPENYRFEMICRPLFFLLTAGPAFSFCFFVWKKLKIKTFDE